MGVAAVGVLYATVKRWFGAGAGLLAGAVLALTPVATLMFRFNNPDALLVLVLDAGAYCVTRALEAASTRWLALGLRPRRPRLPDEDAAGVPGACRRSASSTWSPRPPPLRRRLWQLVVGAGRPRGVGRLVGGHRGAGAGVVAALHRRLAGQQRPQPDLRLQRLRPPHRRRDRQRRRRRERHRPMGGHRLAAAVQQRVRRPGVVAAARRAASCSSPACCSRGGPPAPTAPAPRSCCGAAGCSSPAPRSASARGSSTRTTRWPWRRPSAPWSASAASPLWRRRHQLARPARPRRASSAVTAWWSSVLLGRTPALEPVAAPARAGGGGRRPCSALAARPPRPLGRRASVPSPWPPPSWPAWPARRRRRSPPPPPPTPAPSRRPARPVGGLRRLRWRRRPGWRRRLRRRRRRRPGRRRGTGRPTVRPRRPAPGGAPAALGGLLQGSTAERRADRRC